MKKIILKISVLAFLVIGFTSCESELDQVPFDSFGNENAYISAADFENAIRGVYAGLTSGSMYGGGDGGCMLNAPDILADNVITAIEGRGTNRDRHNWRYVASDGPMFGLYNASYVIANRANLILENIGEFKGETKENIIAEAKAIRAMVYLYSVNFFGKIPTQSGDANGSLGIAYVTNVDPNMLPSRESVGEVYDKIVADLTDALENINVSNPEGRLNKEGVATLLSRVYLYMGKYDLAVNTANMVTTKPASRDKVVGVWEDQNQDGLLFYIPNREPLLGIGIGTAWGQGTSITNYKPEFTVDRELFDLYTDEDIRKEAFITQASFEGSDFNIVKKALGRDGKLDGVVDIKILRASEAYLNKAEAYYRLGNETAARTALDEVRSRRYSSFTGGETGDALWNAIKLERRLEFAFEGQRFFDLKRWGEGVTRAGNGHLADGSGIPADVQTLPSGDVKLQLPIYQGVRDLNPNIQQNPGY